jgi:hypothetical protein
MEKDNILFPDTKQTKFLWKMMNNIFEMNNEISIRICNYME